MAAYPQDDRIDAATSLLDTRAMYLRGSLNVSLLLDTAQPDRGTIRNPRQIVPDVLTVLRLVNCLFQALSVAVYTDARWACCAS